MDNMWVQRHRGTALGVAVVLPFLWCALAAQLDSVTATTDALVLVLLVVGAAASGDRLTGLVAAVASGVWFDFFLTAPIHRFSISDADDVEVTVLLVLVGLAVTEVVLWGRRQQTRASRRAGYLDGVLSTSQIVAGGLSSTELEDGVADQLTQLLGVDTVRFAIGDAMRPDQPVLEPDGEVRVRGSLINVARDGMPTLDETSLAAQHHGTVHGQFLITAATQIAKPSLEQRQVAVLLANQVGAAHATSARRM